MSSMLVTPEQYSQSAWFSTATIFSHPETTTSIATAEPEVDAASFEASVRKILELLPRRAWKLFAEELSKSALLVGRGSSLEALLTTLANWEATAEEMANERNLRGILRARQELRRGRAGSRKPRRRRRR